MTTTALPPAPPARSTVTVSVALWPGCSVPPDAPSTSSADVVLADHVCAAPSAVIITCPCDEVPRSSASGAVWSIPRPGWARVADGSGTGSGWPGRRGGRTGGLAWLELDSGCVTLSKSSSLALALACGKDRITTGVELTGTAPSDPAPARRGRTGPPADVAGAWLPPRAWLP
jgi:hypothetical protein